MKPNQHFPRCIVRCLAATVLLLCGKVFADYEGGGSRGLAITATPEFAVSGDGTTVATNGVQWLSTSDLPVSVPGIPIGIDLARKAFKQVCISPDRSQAALVIAGTNHEWVAILQIADRKLIVGHVLYGGSVSQVIWSPDGEEILIEANEASGLTGMIVVFLSGARPPVRVNALIAGKQGHPVQVNNPSWDVIDKSLAFDTYDASGMAGKRCRLKNDFATLSVLGDLEVAK